MRVCVFGFGWMVVRFVRVIGLPACARVSRVSRVCPGSPRCLFTGMVQIGKTFVRTGEMPSHVQLTERVAATLKRHAEERCHFEERHAKELHELTHLA